MKRLHLYYLRFHVHLREYSLWWETSSWIRVQCVLDRLPSNPLRGELLCPSIRAAHCVEGAGCISTFLVSFFRYIGVLLLFLWRQILLWRISWLFRLCLIPKLRTFLEFQVWLQFLVSWIFWRSPKSSISAWMLSRRIKSLFRIYVCSSKKKNRDFWEQKHRN